jgi:DNA polymerase-3 subunit delta'
MTFNNVLGLEYIKKHLHTIIANNRVPHAQLFVGDSGSGTLPMAIAFARELILSQLDDSKITQASKFLDDLTHPDLHFVYPLNTPSSKNHISLDFIKEWRSFVTNNSYQNLYDWYKMLGNDNKQGLINVREAQEISKRLSLKAHSGGAKVLIIWCADKTNNSAFNKLLKLIEEPPNNTYLILITDSPEDIILTVRSRCQRVDFPPLGEVDIANGLMSKVDLKKDEALKIAQQADGSFTKALYIAENNSDEDQFEKWFITWVRSAFRAKGNKHVVTDLLDWSDSLATEKRETQKRFLQYCMQFFRQAMLYNYDAKSLVFLNISDAGFKFDKFSEFISGKNITEIFSVLETAYFHVERNGNPKLIFSDLSFQLTRLIHKK